MPSLRSLAELNQHLEVIRAAPPHRGEVQLIVRRPETGVREALDEAHLDVVLGLDGDNWLTRGSSKTKDGAADPDKQLTIMSTRAADAVAGNRAGWALAGDQLYIDLDLSRENLPAGTHLGLGDATVVITESPHTGCPKFTRRFGADALRWVNGEVGTELRLRGVNCRVVKGGTVRIGDVAVVQRDRLAAPD